MREKDDGEKLLDLLASLAESESIVQDGLGQAYQLAGKVVYELDELKERVAELREAMAKFRALPESAVWRPAGAVARERVMEAARRLLAGGE